MIRLSGQLAEHGLHPFIKEEFIIGGHPLPKIWILAADAQKASFFRKTDHHLEKIGEAHPIEKAANDIEKEQISIKALKIHNDKEFMKALAKFLDEAANAEAFERLILALPPKTLGQLRPMFSKEIEVRLAAELDKDLTRLNEKQLFDYLDKALWV